MLVFVEDAADAIASADVTDSADVRRRDGRGECLQRPGVGDPLLLLPRAAQHVRCNRSPVEAADTVRNACWAAV